MSNEKEAQPFEIEHKDGKVNIILDMSSFDLFSLCQERYNIRHNLLKVRPGKAEALDRGGLVHEGLEVYFKLLKLGSHFNDRMQAAIQKIRFISSQPDESFLSPEEVERVIDAITQSCEYWRWEDEQMEILFVEEPFAYILYEDEFIRIIITGKIDLLINIPPIGRSSGYINAPMDHKTHQRDSETKELSNQFENYCVATGSNFLFVNKIGLQKTLSPEEKFKRVPLTYNPFKLQVWKDNIRDVIVDEYLYCVETGRWKMNFTSCDKFNRLCECYNLCNAPSKEDKIRMLDNEFATASPWDVTAKLNKKDKE